MAVLSDAGAERAHVVGHDWGAALRWVFASLVPDRVDHLAVLSVGHPSTFRRTLEQREKSWYRLLFQFAGVAEQWLSENNWANFRSWARHPDSEAVPLRFGYLALCVYMKRVRSNCRCDVSAQAGS